MARCEAVYPYVGQCRKNARVEIASRDWPNDDAKKRIMFCWDCAKSAIESGMFEMGDDDG